MVIKTDKYSTGHEFLTVFCPFLRGLEHSQGFPKKDEISKTT